SRTAAAARRRRRAPGPPISSVAKHGWPSAHHVEDSRPACLIEEVEHDVEQPGDAIAEVVVLVLIAGRDERPVEEHGAANHVFLRNKSPVPAIQADIAVVAHGEDLTGRYHQ